MAAAPQEPSPAQARSPGGFALLERQWRRVASTHTLQDLLDADKPGAPPRGPSLKLLGLGLLLILGGAASLAASVFAIVVAPLLPPSERPWLAAVQGDRYYQLLAPLTVPVTLAAIALNWFAMKLFKHNS